jgi:hypothetical protein
LQLHIVATNIRFSRGRAQFKLVPICTRPERADINQRVLTQVTGAKHQKKPKVKASRTVETCEGHFIARRKGNILLEGFQALSAHPSDIRVE